MNIVPYLVCLSGVIGLSVGDLQTSGKFLTKSGFNDAFAQARVKILESEERILQAQQAGTSQFTNQLQDNLSLVLGLMQLKGPKGMHKFLEAVEKGDNFFVRKWIRAGLPVNGKHTHSNETALNIAAISGYSSIVKDLLSAGASPNEKDYSGSTPLHGAAQIGLSDIVDRLIQAGADLNQKDNSKQTPLHLAVDGRHREVAMRLIVAGANPNEQDDLGSTPLHIAILKQMPEVVEALLRAGANETIKDYKGRLPEDLAHRE